MLRPREIRAAENSCRATDIRKWAQRRRRRIEAQIGRSTQHAAFFLATFWTLACGTPAPTTDNSKPITLQAAELQSVLPGIEVLLSDSLHLIRNKRVGIITNHSGRDRNGTSSIDLLHRAPGVTLVAIFGPEHGVRGTARDGVLIPSTIDSATGIPIRSLYGATRTPTPAMLADLDVLLYDIQDVGARVYTYVWTMALAAEAAKRSGKRFVVLDRPNPIRADRIEGGVLEPRYKSFTGLHPVALRYGLTPAELMRYLIGTKLIDADATVVPMKNYRSSMWWDETGLEWRNPSPNIRDLDAALLYPGTVFFEATNVNEGRGTDAPFKLVGAPWLTNAGAIARALNTKRIPGVRFDSVSRIIGRNAKFSGRRIPMIRITVTARDSVRPAAVGAQLLLAIRSRHPRSFRWSSDGGIERLSGSRALRLAVESGNVDALLARWARESAQFTARVTPYRLYQ